MTLVYGLVSYHNIVLAESHAQNITLDDPIEVRAMARYLLSQISDDTEPNKYSFGNTKYIFFYKLNENRLCFMVAVKIKENGDTNITIPFKCIEDLESGFTDVCTGYYSSLKEGMFNDTFSRTIQDKLEFWNTNPTNKVQVQLNQVKEQIIGAIVNLGKRGETLDELGERTDLLKKNAEDLNTNARTLKSTVWWQTRKCQIVALMIFVIIFILLTVMLIFYLK